MAMSTREIILRNITTYERISVGALENLIRQAGIIRKDRIKEYLLWLTAIKIISFDPNSMGETRFLINKEVLNVELQKFGGF
jgi:hypothetical protein